SGRVGRIKHKAAYAGLNKRRNVPQRMPVNISRGHLMLIGLYTQWAVRQSIALRIERIAVIQFHAVAVRKEETIACQHAAAIGGALLHSIIIRALYEASERLNRGVGPAGFLRKRQQRRQRTPQNNHCETRYSEHHL